MGEDCRKHLPRWPCHFAFPPAMSQGSCFPACSQRSVCLGFWVFPIVTSMRNLNFQQAPPGASHTSQGLGPLPRGVLTVRKSASISAAGAGGKATAGCLEHHLRPQVPPKGLTGLRPVSAQDEPPLSNASAWKCRSF